jgi:predicted ABC-type ATPase
MADDLKVIIIAGPNGAGKTTFAREFLPVEAACPVFVNADLIAAGLAPFAPESAAVQAGRVMLEELARHFAARQSFAFETTLSGRGYLHHIREWQSAGYRVKLVFLQLDSAEEAIARVAQRVRQGGHDIPEATIRRRFLAGSRILNVCTRRWWTLGRYMTMQVRSRGCWTGARSHEQTTAIDHHGARRRSAPVATSLAACRAAGTRAGCANRHNARGQPPWGDRADQSPARGGGASRSGTVSALP